MKRDEKKNQEEKTNQYKRLQWWQGQQPQVLPAEFFGALSDF